MGGGSGDDVQLAKPQRTFTLGPEVQPNGDVEKPWPVPKQEAGRVESGHGVIDKLGERESRQKGQEGVGIISLLTGPAAL